MHSACDERNNTLVTYQWVEPRTCRDDLPSSAKLPSGAERRKCPPCNPGMQMDYTTGSCRFCPPGSISDGIRPCRLCPPSTAPNTGFQFIWWSALPAVMSSRCMSLEGNFIKIEITEFFGLLLSSLTFFRLHGDRLYYRLRLVDIW